MFCPEQCTNFDSFLYLYFKCFHFSSETKLLPPLKWTTVNLFTEWTSYFILPVSLKFLHSNTVKRLNCYLGDRTAGVKGCRVKVLSNFSFTGLCLWSAYDYQLCQLFLLHLYTHPYGYSYFKSCINYLSYFFIYDMQWNWYILQKI